MKKSILFFLFSLALLSINAQTIVDPQTFTSDTTVSDTDETYGRPSSTNKKFLMKYIRKYVRQGFSGDITVNEINGVVTLANGVVTSVKLATNAVDSTKAANLSPNDLAQTGATSGQVLTWTGSKYAPRDASGGMGGITALTGDVTASGTGSVAATIANDAVTSAKVASQTLDSTDLKNRGTTLLKLAQSGATNGQVPKYNSTTGNWEAAADGGGTTTLLPKYVPLFVFWGESNSGGFAQNGLATAPELAARPNTRIFNPTTRTFQSLDVGTNNLIGHAGLSDNASHGWELELANQAVSNTKFKGDSIYIVKCGQGGSTISQWLPSTTPFYFDTAISRIKTAFNLLRASGKQPQVFILYSQGINDAIANTSTSSWATSTITLIDNIRKAIGKAPVLITQLIGTDSDIPNYNTTISSSLINKKNGVYYIPTPQSTVGDSLRDVNHWDYLGIKAIAQRMTYTALDTIGLDFEYLRKNNWIDTGGGSITGTGTTDKVAIFTGTSTIGSDANLHYNSTSDYFGIQKTSPASPLHIGGVVNATTLTGATGVRLGVGAGTTGGTIILEKASDMWVIDPDNGIRFIYNNGSPTVPYTFSTAGSLTLSGNIISNGTSNTVFNSSGGEFGIGTSSPDGLQVNATLTAAARGVPSTRMGLNSTTPTFVLEGSSSDVWSLDNSSGAFRWVRNFASVPLQLSSTGQMSFTGSAANSILQLKAGTASAGTAPLTFTSGTNLTTPLTGAVEYDGTEFYMTNSTASRTIVGRVLKGSATLNFPNTTTASSSDLTITVTGAADGDVVSLGVIDALRTVAGTDYRAWVSASNTVTVRFLNTSGGDIDPASNTFKVTVIK